MKSYIQIGALLIAGIIAFSPARASAAVVYMDSSRANVSVGDTVVVSVKVDAQGATLNTVEGNISFKAGGNDVTIQEFSLANSAFGLWPRTPSLSSDGLSVSFVGGVPGGFSIEGATLFKIVLVAKKAGTVNLTPQNISVYANDGKGTKVPVQLKGLALNISAQKSGSAPQDDWTSVVAGDTTPPEDFIVVMGQDKSMFDNKKFAYFSAVDNQSGIAYYEVSENGGQAVRSGSVYVLQDQANPVKLSVTAYDKAGNKKAISYDASGSSSQPTGGVPWLIIVIVVVVLLIVVVAWRSIRKNKKNAPNQF